MALGAMTRVSDSVTRQGSKRQVSYDVVLGTGANYPTSGYTITPGNVGFGRRIENVLTNGIARATSGSATSRTVAFEFLSSGSVQMTIHTTASAEAANNSDQSAFSIRLTFVGK